MGDEGTMEKMVEEEDITMREMNTHKGEEDFFLYFIIYLFIISNLNYFFIFYCHINNI